MNNKNITDENLYQLCKTYGEHIRFWRQKFMGLLPEVFKRRLYEKKGFSSVYEFAAKLAGMSHEQVSLVLRLERKFEDKPVLQKALVSGEISANKLVRIASIATVENQEEIFEKAKILSNRAVEVFVKDVKRCCENSNEHSGESGIGNQNANGFAKPLFDPKSMHVHTLNLDEDVEKELTEMQEKGIDVNAFLRKILQKRKEEIEQEKTKLSNEQQQKYFVNWHSAKIVRSVPTRYIPAKIKKIIAEEHGTKCSFPGCRRPAKTLHHTGRFALMKNHDPRYLAPLCEGHHEIAHKIDLKYFGNWVAAKK